MTNDELKSYFVYEPQTGTMRKILNARKPYPWRVTGGRYLATDFGGHTYYLHRLVWQYHHGVEPKMVDHIDGDTSNNRIENLRVCSPAQNQYNSARKISNKVGIKGVTYYPRCTLRPYQAKIAVDGRVRNLGCYLTAEEAGDAYAAGAALVAGEFARAA